MAATNLAVNSWVIVMWIRVIVQVSPKYFMNTNGPVLAALSFPMGETHSIIKSPYSNSKCGSG